MKEAQSVARRCLVLELLLQRYGLELSDDEPAAERDRGRASWVARLAELGIDQAISADELALLSRKVGELSDDELDDLHGRAAGALVLLWAHGKLPVRPSFADVDTMEETVPEQGFLANPSIKAIKATIEAAVLRPETELESARSAYQQTRGKAREPSSPDAVFADLGVHHLEWVLDPDMAFED